MKPRTFLALLAFLPLSAGAMELHFDKVTTESGETFELTTTFSEPLPGPPALSREAQIGQSPHYDVWVDPEKIEGTRFGFFRYTVFVRLKTEPAKFTQFTVQGVPAGSFEDQFVRVTFKIGEAEPLEEGTISIPIFGAIAPDALTVKAEEAEPVGVHLATPKEVLFTLGNTLQRMPVTITAATASANDGDLWTTVEVRRSGSRPFAPFDLNKGGATPGALVLRLHPRTPAAFANALIRGKKSDDDVITVAVTYKTPAREERTQLIPVHTQFVPWPPVLLPVTLAGALLGWGVRVALKSKHPWRDDLRTLGAAVTVAVLVELVGMLLVARGDSEFRILGFQVDPFQMLPSALIGFMAGLAGAQSRRFITNFGKTPWFKWSKAGAGS